MVARILVGQIGIVSPSVTSAKVNLVKVQGNEDSVAFLLSGLKQVKHVVFTNQWYQFWLTVLAKILVQSIVFLKPPGCFLLRFSVLGVPHHLCHYHAQDWLCFLLVALRMPGK